MYPILSIETSADICSVALSIEGKTIDLLEDKQRNSHSKMLNILIEQIMTNNNQTYSKLKAIAVSYGPGSYTGLRIGMSAAKAICYAHNLALICISSLKILAEGILMKSKNKTKSTIIVPLIDARRMEVYTATYNVNLNEIETPYAWVLEENSFEKFSNQTKILIGGTGAEKCLPLIQKYSNIELIDVESSAMFMSKLSHLAFEKRNFQNVAYVEPFYLKEYIASKPNVKGLKP